MLWDTPTHALRACPGVSTGMEKKGNIHVQSFLFPFPLLPHSHIHDGGRARRKPGARPHNIIILKYYNISGAKAFLSPAPQRFPKKDTYSTAKRIYSTANKTYSTAKRAYSTANRWVLGSRASIEKNEVLSCSRNVLQLWVILAVSAS